MATELIAQGDGVILDPLDQLATALAQAQGEIENAAKQSENPYFKSRYADLAEVLNTVRPVFSKYGLSFIQIPSFNDGKVSVETIMLHKSGQSIRGTFSAPASKTDPQSIGSLTTYLRRYSLAAFAGISQEDDDGNDASGRNAAKTETQKKTAPKPSPKKERESTPAPAEKAAASDGPFWGVQQAKKIEAACSVIQHNLRKKYGEDFKFTMDQTREWIGKKFGLDSHTKLNAEQYEELLSWLRRCNQAGEVVE